MKNIEELNYILKYINEKNIIYIICILLSIITIILDLLSKIPNLNGRLVILGTATVITFSIIKSKNNNKIIQIKKQIYDIETMTKAIEDSKK